MVPSVVMMATMCTFAVSTPFTSPATEPTASTTMIAAYHGMLCCSFRLIAAASASSEPTEMSNPPPMMTKALPMAMTPTIELCRRMLSRFVVVRKFGVMMEMTTPMKRKPIISPYFLIEKPPRRAHTLCHSPTIPFMSRSLSASCGRPAPGRSPVGTPR